jgi:NADP-dependent 3-hydroxy acid dehydrogenase YdfG
LNKVTNVDGPDQALSAGIFPASSPIDSLKTETWQQVMKLNVNAFPAYRQAGLHKVIAHFAV